MTATLLRLQLLPPSTEYERCTIFGLGGAFSRTKVQRVQHAVGNWHQPVCRTETAPRWDARLVTGVLAASTLD
jgi:hypothetical protein